jgi:uncharacterized membrane protein YccC
MPPLPELIGLAIGTLIVAALAMRVTLLAQSLGPDGNFLIAIAGVSLLAAGITIVRALRANSVCAATARSLMNRAPGQSTYAENDQPS